MYVPPRRFNPVLPAGRKFVPVQIRLKGTAVKSQAANLNSTGTVYGNVVNPDPYSGALCIRIRIPYSEIRIRIRVHTYK